ncbi:MAG: hypothetical protein V8S34_06735 [Lawsonibacter sp.]
MKCEPVERLVVDVPGDCVGAVMEKIGSRKGEFLSMNPVGSRTKLEFLVPSRGLFGYRNEFLTDTKGEGIMASVFEKYAPMKGEIHRRSTGSLVAFETGEAVTYGLFNAQERGALFIGAGTPVYAGMIVGECPKQEDISVNVCKKKQLTNMRASGSDEALRLATPKTLSGAVPGVPGGRRAAGVYPREPAPAQAHAGPQRPYARGIQEEERLSSVIARSAATWQSATPVPFPI